MYSWLAGRGVRFLFARLNRGDVRLVLRLFAPDAHFVFPGTSSFAADLHDRVAIEAWFRRFVALGPRFEIHDVVAAGPPWNLRVCTRFTDNIAFPDGAGTLHNPGMQYLRIRWGRVKEDRVYVDTERVADFDARLAAAAPR